MKGWIALDIDGTITQDKYSVPRDVIDFLSKAHQGGWQIALATGRAFVFASPALEDFGFPFILLPQNGSIAIDMPSRDVLFRSYLPAAAIPVIESAYQGIDTDFLVYSGFENQDRCYFRPNRLSKEDLLYVESVKKREIETWIEVDQFPLVQEVPLVKCFGRIDLMKKVALRLSATGLFQVSIIRDPFHTSYHILLVTYRNASKGLSLKEVFSLKGRGSIVIAAGDDENDISLLQAADVKIAMPHAPENVRKIADFIAPPVAEQGIIQALKIAINNAC